MLTTVTELAKNSKEPTHGSRNEVEVFEHVWITMSDGVRLSAKLWLPIDVTENPVPAILEFVPYRKRDGTALRDHGNHAWFSARGYACVRPDMRGHGDSEGLMEDEYLPREQQDAVEIIEWIAAQPWCAGTVGMMGISWGGIASMQAATHQPSALKAIIPVGGSVDRYYDDGAYLVGCYPGQGLGWGGVMFGYCIRPPDPAVVGDAWRDMWFERLEHTPMFAEKWLRHQLRDETWIQGSVCEHYEKIETPVLGVSGWNDCWPNTMIRLLQNIDAPCRVVSGPWGHVYPHDGGPGPKIGFLQLALDWWDHWLKDVDNDVMAAPRFLAFIQDSHEPNANAVDRPGRWVGETHWPSKNITERHYGLGDRRLSPDADSTDETVIVYSDVTVGLATGEYMPISGTAELPHDQRRDDLHSVCFDTDELAEPLEVLGTPIFKVRMASDHAEGLIAVRLCDVAPDGASTLISYGILNLKLRDGRERLSPVIPGEAMDLSVRLNDTGWRLATGHRLRLALSSQLWPMAWPVSENVRLTVSLGESDLILPIRLSGGDETEDEHPFEVPDAPPPPLHQVLRSPNGQRRISHEMHTGKVIYDVHDDRGEIHLYSTDLAYGSANSQQYSIVENDTLSARAKYWVEFSFRREGWNVRTESELEITCHAEHFILKGQISALEDDKNVFSRQWDVNIPRSVY